MSVDLKVVSGGREPEEERLRKVLEQMASEGSRGEPDLAGPMRDQGIDTIQAAMRAEKSRAPRRWAVVGAVAVAAGVAFAVGGSSWFGVESGGVVASANAAKGNVEVRVAEGSDWARVGEDAEILPGSSVRTAPLSGVALQLGEPIEVSLRESTELAFLDGKAGDVKLERGSAMFRVQTLAKGKFFVVRAGSSTVTVHGTEFTITVQEEAAAPCVVVREGLVEVKDGGEKVWLSAGQDFGCALPQEAPEVSSPVESQPKGEEKLVRVESSHARGQVRLQPPEASNLAEQNKLFQKALLAERQGKREEARAHLDAFLARYPDSPLASQVRSQRASLVKRPSAP